MRMQRIVLCSLVSVLMLAACVKRTVLPDPTKPHQLAKKAKVVVWCKTAASEFVKCDLELVPGDWAAKQGAVELE